MTNVLRFGKTAFTWAVVAVTVVASMGVAPLAANAQTSCPSLQAGDLFKVPGNSAVFLLDADLNRMYFPHSSVYNSWYSDYSGVQVIPSSCVSAYPTRTNTPIGVNYRSGSFLIKETIVPTVYAVLPGNEISAIGSEAVAAALYGPNWASLVRDVPASFFANYANTGNTLTEMAPHDGQFIQVSGSSDVYYVEGGMRHMVDGTARGDVRTVSQSVADSVPMGSGSKTAASVYADPAQGATSSGSGSNNGGNQQASGSVSVSLSANTPATALVPQTSSHVEYLKFNVSAGSAAAVLQEVTFKRIGQGSSSNFSKVWLEVNGLPVSNDQSVSSDNLVSLSPNYNLAANGTVEFTLVASLNTASNAQQDAFEITSASAVDAGSGTVTGAFPVRGNSMQYSSYSLGTLSIDEKGTTSTVDVGDQNVIVGEFEIDYSPGNTIAGQLEYVRFKMEGSANITDLANLGVYENGALVSSRTEISGDYVTFVFDAVGGALDEDGETRRLEIRADLTSGDDADTIIFELKDNRDLFVSQSGWGMGITNNIAGLATNQLNTYTLQAGQVTVSLDSSNPTAESYSKGTDDINVFATKLDLGQPITVDGIRVYLDTSSNPITDTATGVNTDIERAELWINGARVQSVTSVSGSGAVTAGGLYYDFDQTRTLNDDDIISLVIDLEANAVTSSYVFEMDASTALRSPEYQASGDTVSTADISGVATGNAVTIAAASATITRNDGYATSEVFISGNTEHKLMSVLVSAGTSGSLDLRTLNFDFAGLSGNTTYFTNLKIMIDGVAFTDVKSLSSSGSVSFSSIGHNIAANGQAQIDLYGTVGSGLSNGTTTTVTLDASDSSVEDSQGDSVSFSDVASATDLTFNQSATLAVSTDGDTAKSKLVVAGGATPVSLGTFKLDATNGAVRITDLYFSNVDSSSAATAVTTTGDNRVQSLMLYVDGSQVGSGRVLQNGNVNFSLTGSQLVVPKDGTARVEVRALFNGITQASQTGAQYRINLMGLKGTTESSGVAVTQSNVTGAYVGTVAITTSTVPAVASTTVGNAIVLHRSVPTLASIASGGITSNGNQNIFTFTVTADSAGDISWKNVTLDISGSCTGQAEVDTCLGTYANMSIKESGNTEAATFVTSTGNLHIILDGAETIAAGTSKTYVVAATLQGFTGDNDALSIYIKDNESSFFFPNTYALASTTDNTFVWTDNSGVDESLTELHWMSGYKVNGLDTLPRSLQ